MLTAPGVEFSVQCRMVSCHSSSACFNAVAFKVRGSVFMIHARFTTDGEPVVLLNGEKVRTLETHIGPPSFGFVIRRFSRLRFSVSSPRGVYIGVRLYDRYLDLQMKIDNQTYCQRSGGLWGNCNGNLLDDLFNRDRVPVTSTNLTQIYISDVFAKSWRVAVEDSLFTYAYSTYREKRDLGGGGYALSFKNSGAHTREIYSFSSSDITIEFMFQIDSPVGTLLSYTTTETFAVTYSTGTVKLQCVDLLLDTLAGVEVGKWYQLALVWSKQTRLLQFYLLDADGKVTSRNFPITNYGNVFEPGGLLSLGYWNPAPSGLGAPPLGQFSGFLDEVRIWNKRLDPFAISSNFGNNVDCSTPSLASMWKFNEGEGSLAQDCVSGAHIYFHTDIWRGPTWIFSTAPIGRYPVVNNLVYGYRWERAFSLQRAEEECDRVMLAAVTPHCTALTPPSSWFYYMSCVTSVTRSGKLTEAYWSALAAADHCDLVSTPRSWYAQPLCNIVPRVNFPEWTGPQCKQYCGFGLPTENGMCDCMEGFYGQNCTLECTGGYARPCGGYGACNTLTGACACPATADTSLNCSKCEAGWTGKDCLVGTTDKSNASFPFCQAYGAAHYTTFDGAGYTFGTHGEYHVIKTARFAVQVRQIPCAHAAFCISSVAVRTGTSKVTIRAPHTNSGDALLWLNGSLSQSTAAGLDAELNFNFRKTAPATYTITNNKPTHELVSLTVKLWKRYLSFELISSRNLCATSSGLCASCDGDVTNDFSRVPGDTIWRDNMSQAVIIDVLSHQWSVVENQSMFFFNTTSYQELRSVNANGYALRFDGTVAFTENLDATFISGSDVTLQFFVKVNAIGGTILSYATSRTFAIVNDITVKLYLGGMAYDTRRTLQPNVWNQISVVYQRKTSEWGVGRPCWGLVENFLSLVPFVKSTH